MSLRIITVVCSIVVLFSTYQIATAEPAIPAAQKEMMEAMKSGDSARIMKAANALAAQRGAPNNARKQNAHKNRGMPALSAADQALIKSAEGKRILAKHAQLAKINSNEASDVEIKALRAKAASDWRKQHPKETREPSIAETYKPVMMMNLNPDMRKLALVQYYPGMEQQQKVLAEAQAKMSRTPHYDKLTPDEKLAVEWDVAAAYREAHVKVDINRLATIHGVNANNLNNELTRTVNAFYASPEVFRKSHIVNVSKQSQSSLQLRRRLLSGEGMQDRVYEDSPTYIGESAVNAKRQKLVWAVVNKLPNNPVALQKWRQLLVEALATKPQNVAITLSHFRSGQANERDVKGGLANGRYVRELNAAGEWPAYTDDWHTLIANDFAVGSGRMIRENINMVIKRATVEMSGCEWTKGLYSVEKHPSTLCDFSGNTLSLTALPTPVSSTSKSK